MKKLLLILAIITIFCSCDNDLKYEQWKDSKKAFGDGTYQIMHSSRDSEDIDLLMNCKHNQCVMSKIDEYIEKKNYVYFVGYYHSKSVLCKLNIKNNLLSYYAEKNDDELIMVYLESLLEDGQIELLESLDDFGEKEKEVFEYLMKE